MSQPLKNAILGLLLSVSFLFPGDHSNALYKGSGLSHSVFETVITQNKNEIPYPFPDLVRFLFQKSGTSSRRVTMVLVPKSRSLQAKFIDFKHPRLLTLVGYQFPTFLGYAPTTNQIEVISFNSKEARFEFHEVLDYKEGGHPHLVQSNRELCIQCHQHGGPIFPRAPWGEMVQRRAGSEEAFFKKHGHFDLIPSHQKDFNLVAEAIIKALGNQKTYYGVDLKNYQSKEDAFIGPTFRGPAATYAFDLRLTNWSAQKKFIGKVLCGQDIECRLKLLKTALIQPAVWLKLGKMDHQARDPILKNYYQKVTSEIVDHYWPKDGFEYPSPVLPDRSALKTKNGKPVGYLIRPLVKGADYTFFDMLNDYPPSEFYYLHSLNLIDFKGVPIEEFHAEETTDSMILDPKTPRPPVGHISRDQAGEFLFLSISEGLNFSIQDEGVLAPLEVEKLSKVLEQSKYREFVYQWPPNTNLVMAEVLKDMKRFKESEVYLAASSENINKVAWISEESLPARSAIHGTLFTHYCASCHLQQNLESYNLPLNDLQKLALVPKICKDLSENKMPPPKSSRTPTSDERVQMILDLKCKK